MDEHVEEKEHHKDENWPNTDYEVASFYTCFNEIVSERFCLRKAKNLRVIYLCVKEVKVACIEDLSVYNLRVRWL